MCVLGCVVAKSIGIVRFSPREPGTAHQRGLLLVLHRKLATLRNVSLCPRWRCFIAIGDPHPNRNCQQVRPIRVTGGEVAQPSDIRPLTSLHEGSLLEPRKGVSRKECQTKCFLGGSMLKQEHKSGVPQRAPVPLVIGRITRISCQSKREAIDPPPPVNPQFIHVNPPVNSNK